MHSLGVVNIVLVVDRDIMSVRYIDDGPAHSSPDMFEEVFRRFKQAANEVACRQFLKRLIAPDSSRIERLV